jgi:hypothetical protein
LATTRLTSAAGLFSSFWNNAIADEVAFSKLRSASMISSTALFPARAPRRAKFTRIFGMTSADTFFSGNAAMGSSTVALVALVPFPSAVSTSSVASPSTTSPRTFLAKAWAEVRFFETFRFRTGISATGLTFRDTETAATSSIPMPDSRCQPTTLARALRMNLPVLVSILFAFSM